MRKIKRPFAWKINESFILNYLNLTLPLKWWKATVDKSFLTPLFYEAPPPSPFITYPFLQLCPTPPSLSPLTNPNPTALSVVLFLWMNGWSCYIGWPILLIHIMDLHVKPWYLSSRTTLMCVLCNKESGLLRSKT